MAAPTLVSHNLVDGLTLNRTLILDFDTALDESTVTSSSVLLTPVSSSDQVVQGSLTVSSARISFLPAYVLRQNTAYRLYVSTAVTASDGTALAAAISLTFTTGDSITEPIQVDLPTGQLWDEAMGQLGSFALESSSPADGAWGVATNPSVSTIVQQIILTLAGVSALSSERDHLLQALEGLEAVQLNIAREVIWNIRSEWSNSQSKVLIGLDRRHPVAVFGSSGVPLLKNIPNHGLKALITGLSIGTIVAVSSAQAVGFKLPDYRPEGTRSRVQNGKDPVLVSGFSAEELEAILTPPAAADSLDPVTDVLKKVRSSRVSSDKKGLVALSYLERCHRRRSRVLVELEDMINALDEVEAKA